MRGRHRTAQREGRADAGQRRAEWRIAAAFLAAAAAAIAVVVVYLLGGQPQLVGALLGLAFAGVAYGLITWAARLLPQGPDVGERHELASSDRARAGVVDDLDRTGATTRRSLLVRTLLLALGSLAAAAVVPLRSLGPRPGHALRQTPWRAGLRLVSTDGRPVNVADVPLEAIVTVFPEGHPGSADGQAVLLRLAEGLLRLEPGREDWTPQGFVAYSKVCTHAGCPVGLYLSLTHELLCPCHQSSFDVLHGAEPVFGPAAAPLPQLPLAIDEEGFLRATGDFSAPVGPAFWGRS